MANATDPLKSKKAGAGAKKESTKSVTTKKTVAKSAQAADSLSKPKATRAVVTAKKAGAVRPKKNPQTKTEEIHAQARKAAQYAIEKKGTTVHVLDLTKITSMTDFFVVVSGDSDKQVKAIAENVIVMMRDAEGVAPWHSEGWESLQWIIIDFVDFVVHVFQAEARIFYNLERLWADAPMEEIKDEPLPVAKRKSTSKASTKTTSAAKKEPIIRVIRSNA